MQHKNLASGRWHELSLCEQMGNIGSEVHRALAAKNKKDEKKFESSILRALELIDLTLGDARLKKRLKELARAREVLCDVAYGRGEYEIKFEDVDRYFFDFACAARNKNEK